MGLLQGIIEFNHYINEQICNEGWIFILTSITIISASSLLKVYNMFKLQLVSTVYTLQNCILVGNGWAVLEIGLKRIFCGKGTRRKCRRDGCNMWWCWCVVQNSSLLPYDGYDIWEGNLLSLSAFVQSTLPWWFRMELSVSPSPNCNEDKRR